MAQTVRAQIAEALEITRGRVTQLSAEGMPVSSVAAAVEWHRANVAPRSDPRKGSKGEKRPSAARQKGAQATVPADSAEHAATKHDDEADDPIVYAVARARREHFAAKLAQIEAEKAAGRVIERAAAERGIFDAFRSLRTRIMLAPRRLASVVAPVTDPREVEALVAEELRRCFAEFEEHVSEILPAGEQNG